MVILPLIIKGEGFALVSIIKGTVLQWSRLAGEGIVVGRVSVLSVMG